MGRSGIKVLHVMTRFVVGGAQDTALTTCADADPSKFDQTLVVGAQTGSEGDLFDEAQRLGVRVIVVPSLVREVTPRDAKALIDLTRLLRQERPAIVHTHSSKAGVLGRVAARCARVPQVVHSVHGWSFHGHMSESARRACIAAERSMAQLTDRFVVENDSDLRKGIDNRIGGPGKYVTIRNGIDLDRYPGPSALSALASRQSIHSELGIPDHAVVVGSVIRFTPQKNPAGLVEAAAQIAKECKTAHFVIVGDGPLRAETERIVQDLGLGNRFHFTGVRRDVPRILCGFDVFALASRWEGLPRVLLEAMASGVAVVAPRVDGISEAIEAGSSGTLVPADDALELAAGVVDLINDQTKREKYQLAGRARVEDRFASSRMVSELEALYEVLGTPG